MAIDQGLRLISDPNKNKQTTNSNGSDFVDMWTGAGIAKVNPLYVKENLKKGWTLEIPTSQETDKMVEIAQQGGQGAWNPNTGVTTVKEPTVQLPNTLTSSYSPQTTMQNSSTLAQQLADAEKARKIAKLKQAYDKTLGTIAQGEQQAIKGQEQARSGIRTQSQMDAKRFEEFLAQRGLSSSGVAPQGFIQQTGQTQGLLGQSQQTQQEALNRFGMQRADAQGQFEFGQADADAVARMTALQAQIDAQNLADQRAYQESLNASDRAYQESQQANEQQRADFNNTILANYNDLQAFANRLVSQNAPQWQIDAILAARQQKISEQGLDQQGRPIQTGPSQDQWDNAYKKWNSGIPLTQQEMQILGTNVAVQPKSTSGGSQRSTTVTQDRSFQEDRWKRLGKADEQVAATWGVPVGTPYNSQITQEPADITPYQNFIENNFVTKATDISPRTINRMGITRYIYGLIEDNKFAEADLLASIYGITDSEFDAIEASLGNQRR